MSVLTEEQEEQLAAVLTRLDGYDTPSLIDSAARIRLPDVADDAIKRRFRAAYAGSIAAQKIAYYLPALRSANAQRMTLGQQIEEQHRKARHLALSDPLGSVGPEIEANALAGLQETWLHIYAVCIRVIFKLLPYAARAAGYRIPKADTEALETFEPLRHFYEHLWEQLPGGSGDYAQEVVKETESEEGWQIVWGLPTDNHGSILLGGKSINVSSASIPAVQDIVERTWTKIHESAIADVEKFLRANPDRVPHPDRIPGGFSSSPGGSLAGLAPFRPWDLEESSWTLVDGIWLPQVDKQ